MADSNDAGPDKKTRGFDYAASEAPIFAAWEEGGYFGRSQGHGAHADEAYTVVIPPPNITGVLHMGHALNNTIQDACIRRARMQGYRTRWVLGTDHAGIATQTKVDKKLADEGVSRLEVGREAFIEACFDWYKEYGSTIVRQLKAMGCSCDFEHEHFTLEPAYVAAVRKAFVDWYHDGLIFRGKRIVNWCPHCETAIADDEAEYIDEPGHLWYLRYPLTEAVEGVEYIVVATTRPETMLGDTGVAVSPKDGTKSSFVGHMVRLPLVDREVPVFSDFLVDPEFGTGFVKVTPAHDANDNAMGARAGLEVINIFDEKATVVEGFGEFSGMSREEARQAVVARFDELGLLDRVEEHPHNVMTCYRCHTKLEPWLSEQWFVAVDRLKADAARAVEEGAVSFYPARWRQVYLDWLHNLKDWCISRQLWWGHRIPIFMCDACGWEDACLEDMSECPACGASVRQDEDVLDTWFSSQLWPFATLGWAQEGMSAPELASAYPTQVLSTARDIMGLWVARMVMSSLYFCKEVPFRDVIIHPTVLGADGKPMSKSRGNGVDPVRLMQDYGADGMRFGLLMQVTGTQDLRFNEEKLENSRNFVNKIRNAARFVLMNLEGYQPGSPEPLTPADRWIFSRLAGLVVRLDKAFESYEFGEVARELSVFFWNEFCDWYIELSKGRLTLGSPDREACQRNLAFVLDVALRLLHPIMPFVTEEIYQDLQRATCSHHASPSSEGAGLSACSDADPLASASQDATEGAVGLDGSAWSAAIAAPLPQPFLIGASWPDSAHLAAFDDPHAERALSLAIAVVSSVRSARARYGISPRTPLDVVIKADSQDCALLGEQQQLICGMANLERLSLAPDAVKPKASRVSLIGNLEVYTILSGLVDFEAEQARLLKDRAAALADVERLGKKLANPGFLAKAAPEVIEKDRTRHAELESLLERIDAQLEEIA